MFHLVIPRNYNGERKGERSDCEREGFYIYGSTVRLPIRFPR